MLEGLDDVPWRRLKHAYGRADDVPDLLRALTTRQRLKRGEESALWHLFGNIHHQGTIYEATAYAVPFLLALVASRRTPDRVGILQLLAAIASGVPSGKGAKAARPAIAKGYETLVAITRAKGELRLNALNVLARLPEHSAKVQRMLLAAMRTERRPIGRVALVLLLGLVTKPSAATTAALTAALASGRRAERRVATVMLCRLPKARRPAGLEPAILEALEADDLEECVEGLPWDAAEDVMTIDLEACLPRKAAATSRPCSSSSSSGLAASGRPRNCRRSRLAPCARWPRRSAASAASSTEASRTGAFPRRAASGARWPKAGHPTRST
jgi:hypothetical protein